MLIDTKCILRYILNDDQAQALKVAKLIEEGAAVYPEVIPEIVYVLDKVYKVDRSTISATLLAVLQEVDVEKKNVIEEALRIYGELNLDYVDCLFLSGCALEERDFFSFDKKLMNKKPRYPNS